MVFLPSRVDTFQSKIENFSIIELTNIDDINFITFDLNEYGDSILISDYGKLIVTDYGSYLLETTNISDGPAIISIPTSPKIFFFAIVT